jgi:non-ribosomal peptide synthetase component E (peptide arylation enzyme)
MVDPHALIAARQCGEIRYAVISDHSADLSRALARFGLMPDASLLVEHDETKAFGILVELLWKDMAYGVECMPKPQAEEFAKAIFAEHACAESKFFSNGGGPGRESWNSLTESTFDAGLVVTGKDHTYFCIWFQDED